MFRTVLVPLDRSGFAEAALPLVARFARGGASVHLALSHELVPALNVVGMAVFLPSDLDAELRHQEESYLAGTADRLRTEGATTVTCREMDGPAGAAVCEEAARVGADLVVMATHGRGSLGRLWHGSVADYVVRHLNVPVLLTHPERPIPPTANDPPGGILVALDLSPSSEAVLAPASELARLTGAPLTLMHMILEPAAVQRPTVDPDAPIVTRVQAGQRLEAIAERLRAQGLSVCTRVASGFNPAWTLREAAAEPQYDVLAVTTHGRGGFHRLWLGSVADQLIRDTTKPILILRPPPAFSEASGAVVEDHPALTSDW